MLSLILSIVPLALPPQIVDGDTFKLSSGEVVRIENIDAPESGGRAKCDAERFLAVHARDGLKAILWDLYSMEIHRLPRKDKYGRTLARVTFDGKDVGRMMIEKNLAVAWEGRRHAWCQASGR